MTNYHCWMKRKWILVSIITLAVSACVKDDENDPSVEVNLDKALILKIANQYRSQDTIMCGNSLKVAAPALIWNDQLAKTALNHSNDMQQNNYYSHTGLNGSKFSERAKVAGYTGVPLGENIGKGSPAKNPEEEFMKAWMESKWHCINIMNAKATEIGIARSDKESDGGSLWTMVLGRQRK